MLQDVRRDQALEDADDPAAPFPVAATLAKQARMPIASIVCLPRRGWGWAKSRVYLPVRAQCTQASVSHPGPDLVVPGDVAGGDPPVDVPQELI
jgi:hypothetical protein